MRARDLGRAWWVASGFCIALACAAQASERLPLAIASTQPQAVPSQGGGVAALTEADTPAAMLAMEAASAAVGSPEASDSLDDYDPLFDEEFDLELPVRGVGDPLENLNRRIFSFNETLDSLAWEPMTRGYQFLVPESVRRGIHRVFLNLESPVIFANQVLQLRLGDAATTLGRFALNTTAGAGGFFDAAGLGAGLERVEGDFGQTLARYGTPSGAFLMVPLFGPTTVRDLCGDVVDRLMDPLTYVIGPIEWWIVLGTSQGLSEREAHSDALDALEASSIDFYSALRSAYHQSREAEIRRARGEVESASSDPVAIGSF
ncbi:MAG TPA: VacJ family lipoprotein [Myxococcota bacterium]